MYREMSRPAGSNHSEVATMTQAIVTRYASSVTLGAAITLSLLLLMQHLIATGENPFVSSAEYRFVPFGRVRPPVPPETRPIPPVKPKPPVKPPDVQRIESGSNGNGPPVEFAPHCGQQRGDDDRIRNPERPLPILVTSTTRRSRRSSFHQDRPVGIFPKYSVQNTSSSLRIRGCPPRSMRSNRCSCRPVSAHRS